MADALSTRTEEVLNHHNVSIVNHDVPEIIKDYTEDSVLFTPTGTYRGIKALTGFYQGFLGLITKEFLDNFVMIRQVVEGEVAYIIWRSPPSTLYATDTFVVKDGKILIQSYAAHSPD